MRKILVSVTLLIFAAVPTFAQNPLVGSWERFRADPPDETAFLILSNDGFFTQTILPEVPKINKPLRDLTKEELIARYEQLVARRGPYRIEGNRLIRHNVAHHNPNIRGREDVELWRLEGDVLILSNLQGKDTSWYRRAKAN